MRSLFLAALFLTTSLFAQVSNDLIVPRAAAPRIFIPVAGNAAGANGTYYRSDISVINLRTVAQVVNVYWYPLGAPGSSTPLRQITINPQSGLASEDFVGDVIGTTGLGGIEFVGVTSGGLFDPDAQLHVTSRVWTPRPDAGPGTMSQTLPAIVAGQATSNVKAVFGMRRGPQYRLNVGVMNLASTTQTFHVTVAVATSSGVVTDTLDIDVPARSIRQELVPGTSSGLVQVLIEDIGGGAGEWQGWASSVDNQSGDAWSQIAVGG
ncbi:MAG TPA: hypothetical protein VM733_15680 [Thermoanaerobaculia bacterium]|nr:hypothetical protein [Thermoanaerobaculia bacterium]